MSGPQAASFFELTPDHVLAAVESAGLRCTGRCMALNSFENRVYDVELEREDGSEPANRSAHHRIAKFYRPGRWSPGQIQEEHEFIRDLTEAEIPAIAPIEFPGGGTLRVTPGAAIHYALFPKVGGRAPDELAPEQLRRIGRLLARIHNVGAAREAALRVRLTPETYGRANLEYLLEREFIPLDFVSRYRAAAEAIFRIISPWFEEARMIRLHGDCHLGNLLWNAEGPFFLDFDDMVMGPAVQDLWLLLPGRPGADGEARLQLTHLLEGYEEMRAFDRGSLKLIEPLRALRLIHYAAWIARRWEDPAFPRAFPAFGTHRYWSDETDELEKQLGLIQQVTSVPQGL